MGRAELKAVLVERAGPRELVRTSRQVACMLKWHGGATTTEEARRTDEASENVAREPRKASAAADRTGKPLGLWAVSAILEAAEKGLWTEVGFLSGNKSLE